MRMRPLRILQVVQGLDVGGVERSQVTLARLHDRSLIELQVCSFRPIGRGPVVRELRAAGIPISSLSGTRLRNPAAISRLVRLVRGHRIDVLHAHLSTPTILSAAAGMLTSRPAMATLHNLSREDGNRSRANHSLESLALRRRMRLVIAVAPEIASDAERSLGIHPRHLAVLPNAIDLSALDSLDRRRVRCCREQLLRGRSGPLIVSIGTLAPRKAHQLLVEATPHVVRRFPDVQVAIVGRDGPNAALVRARIDSLGLRSHVACVGERSDVGEILAAADLFALPSVVEGLPLALLEAMAVRTPVVAAGVGGVTSVVRDRITGWLVAPGDAGELARAMVHSLTYTERSREVASAARARVEAEHSAGIWAGRLTELYAGVGRELVSWA